jgi:hypothetical protein
VSKSGCGLSTITRLHRQAPVVMSSETTAQIQGRRANRPRGRGDAKRGVPRNATAKLRAPQPQPAARPPSDAMPPESAANAVDIGTRNGEVEDANCPVCWICAEPVKYYSLSECNHRTCHVCALRLRALYRKTDCTFCKVISLHAHHKPQVSR